MATCKADTTLSHGDVLVVGMHDNNVGENPTTQQKPITREYTKRIERLEVRSCLLSNLRGPGKIWTLGGTS